MRTLTSHHWFGRAGPIMLAMRAQPHILTRKVRETSLPIPNPASFEWFDSETPPDATSRRIIELVTSPNNPDGSMRSPVVSGENGRAVFDSAYYWPHFTPIEGAPRTTELREHDVALFTLSKLTGHAGTRIGWAVTRDETVATRIAAFVKNAGELPRENQLRGLAVLTVLANQVLFR
mmetsp:Transcript_67401/g.185762  ORF Transcript_67401/g.185762 Transcript_67401/m.185762 type:complete len:177 (-) Transcript_67401:2606-3136(-)